MSLPGNVVPLGTANYDDLSAVVSLTDAPTSGSALGDLVMEPNFAIITVTGQNVRVDYGAVDPTATTGGLLFANTARSLEGCEDILKRAKFIEAAAGGKLSIEYFYGATV
jgi:hypothetical protein